MMNVPIRDRKLFSYRDNHDHFVGNNQDRLIFVN